MKKNDMLKVSLPPFLYLLLLLASPMNVYAETPSIAEIQAQTLAELQEVTHCIRVQSMGPLLTPDPAVSDTAVSLLNAGLSPLGTPLIVVISNVAADQIEVLNADGLTEAGEYYYTYATPTGVLLPDQHTEAKNWAFDVIYGDHFEYTVRVFSMRPWESAR